MAHGNTLTEFIRRELRQIAHFFRNNYPEIIVIGLATLFLTLDWYHTIGPPWASSLIYFAILPVLTIVLILRKNPLDFGLRPGNLKVWSFYIVATCIVALPILCLASRSSFLAAYYIVPQFNLVKYSIETTVYLFAWEFLFRGFLLFGLKEKLKESSILVQMVPFVLLHFGKPEIETISTIIMGIYFGYVAYRGNSFWPAFIIHLFINIVFVIFVNIF
jgi:membrane protease YdiL (CAAX protease family)